MKRPKTPEQLANKEKRGQYTLYLNVNNMNYIKERASKTGIGASLIVDEAINLYLKTIRKKSGS
jgi:hypothetical protein